MTPMINLLGGNERTLRRVKINQITKNPYQPRRYFEPEAIRQLSDSIRLYGVLNPLTVRRTNDGYELIAGERRLRAAKMAGLQEVPCIVMSATEEDSSAIALVENLQRRDLDFFEEAAGYRQLIELYGLTQEEAAQRVGKTQSAVANKLRLLKLSAEVTQRIRDAGLTERHARALLRLPEDSQRVNAITYITAHDLNVARTEQYIDGLLEQPPPAPTGQMRRLIRDVRFFINTVDRAVDIMQQSGVAADVKKEEADDGLRIHILIPHARK